MDSAAILSIGEEIILGQIIDTNASWLSRRLVERGWMVDAIRTVGDDMPKIVAAIRELAADHGILILTGGLGPTADDLTREALAQASGNKLEERPELIEMIAARFRAINREMTPVNRVQALIPAGAEAIPNHNGTAPGIAITIGQCRCFSMPGVPREMEAMFKGWIEPRLGVGPSGAVAIRELHFWGIGEGTLGEIISDLMARGRQPVVGTRVRDSVVTVRIRASAASAAEAAALAAKDEATLRERLGKHIFATGTDTLASAAVKTLIERKQSLATAESCTGGLVAWLITDIAGASGIFREGFVTYANESKTARLGVPAELIKQHGAVSEPVARAMAEGVRRVSGTDWGIGITGIAGPGGGTKDKPVGLIHIAVAGASGTMHEEFHMASDREGNRSRAAFAALGMLWKCLLGDKAQ